MRLLTARVSHGSHDTLSYAQAVYAQGRWLTAAHALAMFEYTTTHQLSGPLLTRAMRVTIETGGVVRGITDHGQSIMDGVLVLPEPYNLEPMMLAGASGDWAAIDVAELDDPPVSVRIAESLPRARETVLLAGVLHSNPSLIALYTGHCTKVVFTDTAGQPIPESDLSLYDMFAVVVPRQFDYRGLSGGFAGRFDANTQQWELLGIPVSVSYELATLHATMEADLEYDIVLITRKPLVNTKHSLGTDLRKIDPR